MISKAITGKTFSGACRYICKDQNRAVILKTEGVRDYDQKMMAKNFETQHQLNPNLHKAVFHGILSFYPGEKVTDATMVEIAEKYPDELKITNTQYVITKHIDKSHQHLHILANLVNNDVQRLTIWKSNWRRMALKQYTNTKAKQRNYKVLVLALENLNTRTVK